MSQNIKSNPLGLPETGVVECPAYYRNATVYLSNGRSATIRDIEETSDGLVYTVLTTHEENEIKINQSELSLVPNNLAFEFFLNGLEVVKVADENGNWSTDERIKYILENYDDEAYSPHDYYDSIIICKYSGAYFEYDSIKKTYTCVVGNNSVATDSFREAAKMPFEWAITECGLFESDDYISAMMETLFIDGKDKAIQLITEEPQLMANGSLILLELASKSETKELTIELIKSAVEKVDLEKLDLALLGIELKERVVIDDVTTSLKLSLICQDDIVVKVPFFVEFDSSNLDISVDSNDNYLSDESMNEIACHLKLSMVS